MSQINPFIAGALQAPNVQRQQAEDRDAVVARQAQRPRTLTAGGDTVELTVESADAAEAVGDRDAKRDRPKRERKRKSQSEGDVETHLDLRG